MGLKIRSSEQIATLTAALALVDSGQSKTSAAAQTGIHRQVISLFEHVRNNGVPELYEKVSQGGEISLRAAFHISRQSPDVQRQMLANPHQRQGAYLTNISISAVLDDLEHVIEVLKSHWPSMAKSDHTRLVSIGRKIGKLNRRWSDGQRQQATNELQESDGVGSCSGNQDRSEGTGSVPPSPRR